jgi:hypothetical protein
MTQLEVLSGRTCDTCGGPLGPITYTRRAVGGTFCSETCREGAEAVAERSRNRRGIELPAKSRLGRAERHRTQRLRRKKWT